MTDLTMANTLSVNTGCSVSMTTMENMISATFLFAIIDEGFIFEITRPVDLEDEEKCEKLIDYLTKKVLDELEEYRELFGA